MGLVLMADDLSLLVGEIRGIQRAIEQRLDRQDAEGVRRDELTERNKQAAIQARGEKEAREDQKHAENTIRLEAMDRKLTTTFGLSSVNDQWINKEGKPAVAWVNEHGERLVASVKAIEDGKTIEAAETRGAGKTWAFIIGIGGAVGTALAGIITYGRDAVDFVKGLGH